MIVYGSETRKINRIINAGAASMISNTRFLEKEIQAWKYSQARKDMIVAEQYYRGNQDMLRTPRMVIGEGGVLTKAENLPDNRIVDNQYQKAVDQKKNYLFSKPFSVTTENDAYTAEIKNILDKKFTRTLIHVAKDSINGGIGYLFPYYNKEGILCFRRFHNYEIIPFWADEEHMELDSFGRLYQLDGYEGEREKTFEFFELYTDKGIDRYQLENGRLVPDSINQSETHYKVSSKGKEKGYNWNRIPLVVFKRNEQEIPLIRCCKTLQDGINLMASTFENNMCEDSRNTILVVVNYDGTKPGEFRHNLAQYGMVKVRSDKDTGGGDVKAITIEVNAENYKAILELFKLALIENCKAYDAKDTRLTGDANQMHIQTIYQDIELDAQDMETEYQAAFEDLFWFTDQYLINAERGNYEQEEVNITFNRNMLVNETELIDNCIKSFGLLPTEIIFEKHPWIKDVKKAMEMLKEEQERANADRQYENAFKEGDGENKNVKE